MGARGQLTRRLQVAASNAQIDRGPQRLRVLVERLLVALVVLDRLAEAQVAGDEGGRAGRTAHLGLLEVGAHGRLDDLAEAVLQIGERAAYKAGLGSIMAIRFQENKFEF